MRWLLELFRALFRSRSNSLVRPWALSAPVLILLLAMPLLRPVRHPDPREVGDEEMALLATTQALVEQKTLASDHTFFSVIATRRETPKSCASANQSLPDARIELNRPRFDSGRPSKRACSGLGTKKKSRHCALR